MYSELSLLALRYNVLNALQAHIADSICIYTYILSVNANI